MYAPRQISNVAGTAKSGNQASNIGVILGLVLAAIGGCIPMAGGSTYRAGGFIGTLARLTPHAHALEGYFRLMMENGTVVTVLPQMGILLAFGVVFFLIAVRRFKFE